jgi:hypothetical protein
VHEHLVPTLVSILGLEVTALEDDMRDKECPTFGNQLTIPAVGKSNFKVRKN